MPEMTMEVDAAVKAAAKTAEKLEEQAKTVAAAADQAVGAMSLSSPAAAKIAQALEKGNLALEQQTKLGVVVINPEEMSKEARELVDRLKALDQALIDNRHIGLDRLKGDKENPKNIKDPELDKKLKEDLEAHLKLRSERINQLAREILFLYDWYQAQPGMNHLPTHALQFKEVITKPQKQTKGLRRKQSAS